MVSVDYRITDDDVVMSANPGRVVAEDGEVAQESVTIDVERGTERSNGYRCAKRSDAVQTASIPGAPPVVIAVSRRDFAQMPVAPLRASAGPGGGWLPVNMVNVLHADPRVQTLDVQLLGVPVQVRAIPVEYHWDLGDGNTITTSKPGAPYPSQDVTAQYRYAGWYDVTLTTTFTGQYSVDGGPWQDIDGTIQVASAPVAIYSKSLTARLTDPYSDRDQGPDHTRPWVPERTPDTEGPHDPHATHRRI